MQASSADGSSADGSSFAEMVSSLATSLSDLADDVNHGELIRAVRHNKTKDVTKYGQLCKRAVDVRTGKHCANVLCALCAPPVWLAVYQRDHASASALLDGGADPNCCASPCPAQGGRPAECRVGGLTALQMAVGRSFSDCVRRLLKLGASADLPFCFAVDDDDEPEWDEASQSFGVGLAGLSALQLAAVRADEVMCTLLLSHGADADKLDALATQHGSLPAAVLKATARLTDDDGESLECAICMEDIRALTSAWTPCCCRAFHAHCLRGLAACPLCRTQWRGGPQPLGDAEVAAALVLEESPVHRPFNSLESTRNHERALELAFSGPHFQPNPAAISSHDAVRTIHELLTGT